MNYDICDIIVMLCFGNALTESLDSLLLFYFILDTGKKAYLRKCQRGKGCLCVLCYHTKKIKKKIYTKQF